MDGGNELKSALLLFAKIPYATRLLLTSSASTHAQFGLILVQTSQ